MKRFNAAPFLTLVIIGCSHSTTKTNTAVSADERTSVIRVGMDFENANALLMEHGAKPTGFQVVLAPEYRKRGLDHHFYDLQSGAVMSIISKPGKSGRIVDSISVSTYEPKSWESKTDPERDKFFQSFTGVDEYDFRKRNSFSTGSKEASNLSK